MVCSLAPRYMMRSTQTFPFRKTRNPKAEIGGLDIEMTVLRYYLLMPPFLLPKVE
jgi:hypothetical protein